MIKDLGLKEPYVGQTNLVTGEIGDDLANYFMISEQQPSVVALGVLINPDWSVRAAGGYIIQPLPGADDEVIDKLEQKLAQVPAVSRLAADGNTPEEILHILLEDFDPKVLSKTPMQFKCDCNRERLERVVLSLGREELMDIIETEEKPSWFVTTAIPDMSLQGKSCRLCWKRRRRSVNSGFAQFLNPGNPVEPQLTFVV